MENCSFCGAEFPAGEQCRGYFDQCLAFEYENPTAYGAVHLLTVACYMLQHNAYSRDVWLEARNMVTQFLDKGITPLSIRKQNRQKLDSGHRTWSVTKGAKLSEFYSIHWSRTIADVRLDSPEHFCADVRVWAASILEDSEDLVHHLEEKTSSNSQH
jgi:hypothetical protein